MQIAQVMTNDFECLNTLGAELKKTQATAYKYINRLATMTSTDITKWNLVEIFGTGLGHQIVHEHGEINKRFFAYKEKPASVKLLTQVPNVVPPELLTRAEESIQAASQNNIAAIERAITGIQSNITSYQKSIEEWTRSLSVEHLKIQASKNASVNLKAQIEEIVSKNFWMLWNINSTELSFASINPIALEQVNELAKIDIHLNFGHFIACYNYTQQTVFCKPGWNNIGHNTMIHPHIFHDRRVCWGTANLEVATLLAKRDLAAVMGILSHILTNYNEKDPIYGLSSFSNTKVWNEREERPKSTLELLAEQKSVPITHEDEEYDDLCGGCERNIDNCSC